MPAEPPRLLLTSREAAKLLCISERKLWELTDRGELPAVRVDRVKRYDPSDLRQWIDRHKVRAHP